MRLKNYKAAGGISKYIGLMFSLKEKRLVFEFKKEGIYPIHMLFVFFPIDVLYLSRDKRVVEIKENLKPFSYYKPKNMAMYIVEAETGFVKSNRIKAGDRVVF